MHIVVSNTLTMIFQILPSIDILHICICQFVSRPKLKFELTFCIFIFIFIFIFYIYKQIICKLHVLTDDSLSSGLFLFMFCFCMWKLLATVFQTIVKNFVEVFPFSGMLKYWPSTLLKLQRSAIFLFYLFLLSSMSFIINM